MSHPSLAKRYPACAVFEIGLGAECVVQHPGHDDMESWKEYTVCDGQKAVVVGLKENSVDIEMKTGSYAGRIVTDVNPRHLFFSGVFQRAPHAEEAHS